MAVIGIGDHGISWYEVAYLKFNNCRVIAVCDVDSELAMKAKKLIDY